MFFINKNTILLASAISAALSHTLSYAEEVPTVVVSASRSHHSSMTIPGNIKVISRQQIEDSGATSVAEVLNGVGGVHVTDLFGDGSSATISMRGFGETAGSNVLVIVDGRRLNNIDLTRPDLNAVSVKDIEQVEIVQGSAGVLYGDQAVGGVINIVTRKPQGFKVDTLLQTGSYDRTRFVGSVSDKVSDELSYLVSAEALRTDNYRDNNDQDNVNLLGRMDYELPNGGVFVEAQRVRKVSGLPGSLTEQQIEEDRRQANSLTDFVDSETEVARLGGDVILSEEWSVEAELAARDFQSSSEFSGIVYTIDAKQTEFTPRLIGSLPMNDSQAIITAGFDYLESDYETFSENDYETKAVYLQAVLPVSSATHVTVGGRKADYENTNTGFGFSQSFEDDESAFEIAIQSEVNENLSVFFRIDENFRFAKIDEITFTEVGKSLDVQTGQSNEIGVDYTQGELSLKAQVYRLEIDNEIAYDPNANGPVPGFGANVNLDPTLHDGMILEAAYSLQDNWDLAAAFTYNDATFDEGVYEGNNISGVPERQLSVNTSYRVSKAFKTYVEALHVDDHYAAGDYDNSAPKLDAYTVVNTNLAYSWDEFELSLRINNLFDKEYSTTAFGSSFGMIFPFPSPERNFWLTASVRFE